MPRVSVIINVRNGAATLSQAIDSVLCQTFADWELIVWDDRSTDTSGQIAAGYPDPRIRYFLSSEDTPLGKARGDAIAQAKGEWIAFLDQDDIWLPHKLERQIALAEDGIGLIYGRTIRFHPTGRERDYDHAHEYSLLPEGDIFEKLFSESCFIAMSSAMFRRSAIEGIGGIPDEVRIIPDYYLYVAVARQYRARAVQPAVCRYRMHPGSMSQVTAVEMHKEALGLIDRWSGCLDAELVERCRRRHLTQIALEEMRRPAQFSQGLVRLMREGSLISQIIRPFMFAFHVVRRAISPPYWRRLDEKTEPKMSA
jgi:glycosyltransferase involved in cell wall biosynthesis